MKRTIYNFYCYCCFEQNIAAIPYPLDTDNGKIIRIYCPNCHAWIPYTNTNLSASRYKLIHRSDWCIVDEDTPKHQLVYAVKKYNIAQEICNALNNETLSLYLLYSNLCFK